MITEYSLIWVGRESEHRPEKLARLARLLRLAEQFGQLPVPVQKFARLAPVPDLVPVCVQDTKEQSLKQLIGI
ncbi:hypothetical protein Dsin_003436 [Dipteronia sinensis]|uniref:Uncharacterized protein n=1 Tax=Dipteronia sinensis TaxID=43782 RepID=A0AAE0B902_9ROSI|nr:hypothetical protein Dsin_003436 [Dipteronia sinensis]